MAELIIALLLVVIIVISVMLYNIANELEQKQAELDIVSQTNETLKMLYGGTDVHRK